MRKRDVRMGAIVTHKDIARTIEGYRNGWVYFLDGSRAQVEDVTLLPVTAELLLDACSFKESDSSFVYEDEEVKVHATFETTHWRVEIEGANASFRGFLDTFEQLFTMVRMCRV